MFLTHFRARVMFDCVVSLEYYEYLIGLFVMYLTFLWIEAGKSIIDNIPAESHI